MDTNGANENQAAEQPIEQEVANQQTVDNAQTVPELEALKKQLEETKAREIGQMRKVRELTGEKEQYRGMVDSLSEQIALVNQRIDLLSTYPQSGMGEGNADYDRQLADLRRREAEINQRKSLDTAYNKVKSEILDVLADGDIEVDSDEEAQKLIGQFNEARKLNTDPTGLIKEARKMVTGRLKAQKPDVEKLKEQIKKELLEETKRGMKVDTGAPTPSLGSFADIEAKFSRGEISMADYTAARKKASLP